MSSNIKLIAVPARKPAIVSEVRDSKDELDPFRRLSAEEKEAIRISFFERGRSVRSIARLIDCAESKVEETLRDAKAQAIARAEVAQNIRRIADQVSRRRA